MPVYEPFIQCFVSWFHFFPVVRKNAKMMMSIYEPLENIVIKCCKFAKKESFEQKTFALKNRKEVLRCDLCPSICRVFNRYT